MHSYLLEETVDFKKDEERRIHRSASLLYQVASVLGTKKFHWFFRANESRFHWTTDRLHDRLRKDLMLQANQLLSRRRNDAGDAEYLKRLGEVIGTYADSVCAKYNVDLTQAEKTYPMPRSTTGINLQTKHYKSLFDMIVEECVDLDLVRDAAPTQGFYVGNLLSSMRIYLESRYTLVEPFASRKFEKMLNELSEEYLLDGYPHDILAHDAVWVRAGRERSALALRKEYCSSWWVDDMCKNLLSDPGFKIIYP